MTWQVSVVLRRTENRVDILRDANPLLIIALNGKNQNGAAIVAEALKEANLRFSLQQDKELDELDIKIFLVASKDLTLPVAHYHPRKRKQGDEEQKDATKKLATMRKTLKSWLKTVFGKATDFKPLVHQEAEAKRFCSLKDPFEDGARLLLWRMGSGKTEGVLYILEKCKVFDHVYIVTTNSTIGWWTDTVAKMSQGQGRTIFHVIGVTEFSRLLGLSPHLVRGALVIVDEAHHFRNMTQRMSRDCAAMWESAYTFVLTGTPVVNHHGDHISMALLMKCRLDDDEIEFLESFSTVSSFEDFSSEQAAQDRWQQFLTESRRKCQLVLNGLPQDAAPNFRKIVATTTTNHVVDVDQMLQDDDSDEGDEEEKMSDAAKKEQLRKLHLIIDKIYRGRVSYYDPEQSQIEKADYPQFAVHTILVPMSWEQTFDYLYNKRQKFQLGDVTFQSAVRNAYHSAERRIANSRHEDRMGSPKFNATVNLVTNVCPGLRQVIHSQFLDNGILTLQKMLESADQKIRVKRFIGATSTAERDSLLKDYNVKKAIDVMLISDAGGVGISLLDTDVIYSIDVHASTQLKSQMWGRVLRCQKNRKNPFVGGIQLLSTFPTQISKTQRAQFEDYVLKRYLGGDKNLVNCDILNAIFEKIHDEEHFLTIDQRTEMANITKQTQISESIDRMHYLSDLERRST